MIRQLQTLYGLKWNPFLPDAPLEGLVAGAAIEHFAWRIEQMGTEGGFALVTGDPGIGKSVALRFVVARLASVRDLQVGVLARPHSHVADFYRELGDLFGVTLSPHNRWAGSKVLRERWRQHTESTLVPPGAGHRRGAGDVSGHPQRAAVPVQRRSRRATSAHRGARRRSPAHRELSLPRAAPARQPHPRPSELWRPPRPRIWPTALRHALEAAGNPELMTPALIDTLTAHAAGNRRVLMNLGAELLAAAVRDKLPRLDEQLFLHVCGAPAPRSAGKRR